MPEKKKYDKPVKLNMSFSEAFKRLLRVDKDQLDKKHQEGSGEEMIYEKCRFWAGNSV